MNNIPRPHLSAALRAVAAIPCVTEFTRSCWDVRRSSSVIQHQRRQDLSLPASDDGYDVLDLTLLNVEDVRPVVSILERSCLVLDPVGKATTLHFFDAPWGGALAWSNAILDSGLTRGHASPNEHVHRAPVCCAAASMLQICHCGCLHSSISLIL